MPELVKNLDSKSLKVAEKAIIAIDMFCENLEIKVKQYLPILLPSLA
jgi:hypothetical protein